MAKSPIKIKLQFYYIRLLFERKWSFPDKSGKPFGLNHFCSRKNLSGPMRVLQFSSNLMSFASTFILSDFYLQSGYSDLLLFHPVRCSARNIFLPSVGLSSKRFHNYCFSSGNYMVLKKRKRYTFHVSEKILCKGSERD